MYHGTSVEFGKKILIEQKMRPSRGDDQWLGDGQYFFRNDFYAFRWIVIKYTEGFKNNNTKKIELIYDHYMILKADINLNPDRVYSLYDPIAHANYMNLLDLLQEKQEYSEKYKNKEIVDGVVINILFTRMGYGKRYDAVEAMFNISTKSKRKTRFNSFSEYQVCIKNSDIIKRIVKFNNENVPEQYIKTLNDYNIIKFGNTRGVGNARAINYKTTHAYKYK